MWGNLVKRKLKPQREDNTTGDIVVVGNNPENGIRVFCGLCQMLFGPIEFFNETNHPHPSDAVLGDWVSSCDAGTTSRKPNIFASEKSNVPHAK
jgi:hypothetical protein